MAGIADFISMATKQLGVPQGAAQAGVGGLLDLVKKQAGGDVFGKLTNALPDAASITKPVAPAPASGGGLGGLGGIAQMAGGLLGGSGGGALGVLGTLQGAGIGADKAPAFVGMFVEFLKGKLSPDLLNTILSKVGDLKKLAG